MGKNKEDHNQNLQEILYKLHKTRCPMNVIKCKRCHLEINYLAHIIDKEGLRKDPHKVNSILKVQRPTNVTEVKAFIGIKNGIPSLSRK